MTADATVQSDSTAVPVPAARPVIRDPLRVVAVAAAIGLAGQLLFFDVALGINVPIALLLLLGGGWALRQRAQQICAADAWLAPAAILFAAFAALRADPALVFLDILAALGLGGAALASFGGRSVLARGAAAVIALAIAAAGWVIAGAVAVLGSARSAVPQAPAGPHRLRRLLPVARGLAIAAPIVLLFVALFSAADAVFAELVGSVFDVDLAIDEVIARGIFAGLIAWVAAGSIGMAASTNARPSAAASTQGATAGWRLGRTEVLTVLVAVNVVFGVFVVLQAAYLFGGLDTLEATGLTHAEYARRGFFELVAVALLACAVVIGSERLVRGRPASILAAATGLTVLTGVVLVSALLRLRLYQEAFGWTELRLYVLAVMAVLAVSLAALVAMLLLDRVRWFGHLFVLATLAAGIVLNIVGPVRFITEQNVARALNPALVPAHGSSGLDDVYAASLGDDAIPILVAALPHLDRSRAEYVASELRFRLERMQSDEGPTAWQAWNLGRSQAREALDDNGWRAFLP